MTVSPVSVVETATSGTGLLPRNEALGGENRSGQGRDSTTVGLTAFGLVLASGTTHASPQQGLLTWAHAAA